MVDPEPIQKVIGDKSERLKKSQLHCDVCKKDTHNTEDHGKNGGKRKGAGFPTGVKKKKTLEAIKVRDAMTQRIMKHADDLFNAQFDLAVGEKVLMVKIKERDSKGRVIRTYFEQVTNKETIKQYLDYEYANQGEDPNDDEHFFFMTTKPANNQALESLINRAIGKVPDKLEVEGRFFSAQEVVIKVVGARDDIIDIGEDGQLVGAEDRADDEQPSVPSDDTSQPPTSS